MIQEEKKKCNNKTQSIRNINIKKQKKIKNNKKNIKVILQEVKVLQKKVNHIINNR